MTKRRAIYGTAATSLSLARCCPEAQLLFDRLVSQADDQGRLQGDPMLVKAQCVPLIDKATTRAVDRWLGELADNGMILRYESAGQPLLQIVKWWEHQDWMRHAYGSRWPSPDGWDDQLKGSGKPADDSPPDAAAMPAPRPHDADTVPPERGAAPASDSGGDSDSGGGMNEIETSRDSDAREASPPPQPTDLYLNKVTTTHFDLTGKRVSPGGEQMYRDLLRQYGVEVVNRAQWNEGATDKADRGFIGRVKTRCKRLAA